MNLTEEQLGILKGEKGEFLAKYMSWMVKWGEIMGAKRMVPVTNVHCILRTPLKKGISLSTINSFCEEIRNICQHKVKCTTLTHVRNIDFDSIEESGISETEASFMKELDRLAPKAGILTTWTCTPYLVGSVPVHGEICAWTESSAVVYANSILGAKTTRHGMVSSDAAALLGWVPEFGVLINSNRRGTFLINVETELKTPSDWGAVGFFAGSIARTNDIPVICGPDYMTLEDGKQISAAIPYAGGAVTMFHAIGITPEAPDLQTAFQGDEVKQIVKFTKEDLDRTYSSLQDVKKGQKVDTVIFGCPFASLPEIMEIANFFNGRKLAEGVKLWVCTSYQTMEDARRMGYIQKIKESGGKILTGTCPGSMGWLRPGNTVTNSFKQAHYCRGSLKAKVSVGKTEKCLEAAVKGRWYQ